MIVVAVFCFSMILHHYRLEISSFRVHSLLPLPTHTYNTLSLHCIRACHSVTCTVYSTVLHSTVLYSTVLYLVQYDSTVQYSTVPYGPYSKYTKLFQLQCRATQCTASQCSATQHTAFSKCTVCTVKIAQQTHYNATLASTIDSTVQPTTCEHFVFGETLSRTSTVLYNSQLSHSLHSTIQYGIAVQLSAVHCMVHTVVKVYVIWYSTTHECGTPFSINVATACDSTQRYFMLDVSAQTVFLADG